MIEGPDPQRRRLSPVPPPVPLPAPGEPIRRSHCSRVATWKSKFYGDGTAAGSSWSSIAGSRTPEGGAHERSSGGRSSPRARIHLNMLPIRAAPVPPVRGTTTPPAAAPGAGPAGAAAAGARRGPHRTVPPWAAPPTERRRSRPSRRRRCRPRPPTSTTVPNTAGFPNDDPARGRRLLLPPAPVPTVPEPAALPPVAARRESETPRVIQFPRAQEHCRPSRRVY